MAEVNNLCFHCMGYAENGICTKCGYDNNVCKASPKHLRPGTVINGKYFVGEAIGTGGFGVTYIGFDTRLEMKVAIKEYFPASISYREENSNSVIVYSNDDIEKYNRGRASFINEARALAKFDRLPGVVSVKDFFEANNTAYIVMEFIEGETLETFLSRNGGKVSANVIINMLKPVITSLIQIHKSGIIHRDISPDNIMITKYSEVKLIDFGSAYHFENSETHTTAVQLKHGYAPEEQYRMSGQQGPWTDVYAICATIYRCVTGSAPVPSVGRVSDDTLIPPSAMGAVISPQCENAV